MLIKRLLILFFTFFVGIQAYSQQVLCAKIPGYTGYSIPNDKGIVFDELLGCTQWSNENITVQYNMQIEAKGELILKMMLSNDGPSPAYISVKFGDRTKEIKVPPSGGPIQYILVDAGIFTVDYPGFYSVWIKPISKTGQFYPGIMNVQLCTPFADKIAYPTIPDRNASTVNLTYLNPQKNRIAGMVINAVVPNNFDYKGTRVSAIGNEVFKVGMANETKGRYIYMSWKNVKGYDTPQFRYSQFKNYLIDSSSEKFTRLIIPYNWSPDHPVAFSLTHQLDTCTGEQFWEAQVFNDKKKKWHTIGVVNGGNTIDLVKDWNSTIANSDPNTGNVEHKALFSNQYFILADGSKFKVNKARFGHDIKGKKERKDYGAGIVNNSFWLSTGGFSFPQATYGRVYELKGKSAATSDETFLASFETAK